MLVSTHYMDEAERCHDIAYIFNGELIARGTADELIADSRLVTFEARGPARRPAGARACGQAGRRDGRRRSARRCTSAAPTARRWSKAIAPFRREPWHWTEVEPTLEDVFIHLMQREQAQDERRREELLDPARDARCWPRSSRSCCATG